MIFFGVFVFSFALFFDVINENQRHIEIDKAPVKKVKIILKDNCIHFKPGSTKAVYLVCKGD